MCRNIPFSISLFQTKQYLVLHFRHSYPCRSPPFMSRQRKAFDLYCLDPQGHAEPSATAPKLRNFSGLSGGKSCVTFSSGVALGLRVSLRSITARARAFKAPCCAVVAQWVALKLGKSCELRLLGGATAQLFIPQRIIPRLLPASHDVKHCSC